MNRFVQVPAKGQPMTAQWGADVANGLNAIRSAGQVGMLLADGPTGTGFAPLPANRRDRRGGTEIPPREFALRAKVETKTEGDAKKYRLKIGMFHVHGSSSVTWNGMHIPSNLTDTDQGEYEYVGTLGKWIELETTEWTESFDFNKNYYLCVSVEVEFDGEGKERQYNFSKTGMTFWEIKEEAIPVVIYQGDVTWHCQAPYLLGHVKALGTNIEVRQNYDGPLHLFDLMGQIGDEGEGGENDDRNGTNYPMPFQYKRTDTVDPETGEVIDSSYWIVNCKFYWNGELKTLSDFVPPATGTVYLNCTQEAPSGSTPKPEWTFAMATSEAEYPSGGRGRSFRLYDFESHLVTCDYRTTFLALETPHKTAYAEIGRPQSDPGVVLDATTEDPKIVLKSGSGEEKVRIGVGDLNALAGLSGGNNASFNVLTVHKKDGEEKKYAVLSNEDIDVYESGEAAVEVVGTDGSSATASKKITFEAEEDSKVTVKVSGDDMGNVTVKIGVYYK